TPREMHSSAPFVYHKLMADSPTACQPYCNYRAPGFGRKPPVRHPSRPIPEVLRCLFPTSASSEAPTKKPDAALNYHDVSVPQYGKFTPHPSFAVPTNPDVAVPKYHEVPVDPQRAFFPHPSFVGPAPVVYPSTLIDPHLAAIVAIRDAFVAFVKEDYASRFEAHGECTPEGMEDQKRREEESERKYGNRLAIDHELNIVHFSELPETAERVAKWIIDSDFSEYY
ncbi:hypothetical protein PFISCL1PPCAC_9698, partial [Pristionchus fissidentatus]